MTNEILTDLPEYVPRSERLFTEDIAIVEDAKGFRKTVYTLDKAPFEELRSVRAVVNNIEREFDIGSDVTAVDTNGDTELDSIEFTNPEFVPDVGTTATVEYVSTPLIVRYTEAYDTVVAESVNKLDDAQDALFIDTATGQELDLIGSVFAEIGERQARSDAEYRSYLKSIVNAFTANGTVEDIVFAVVQGSDATESEVTVKEYPSEQAIEVLLNTAGTVTDSLNVLIDISKPSGVKLKYDPVIPAQGSSLGLSHNSTTVVTTETGLDGGEINLGEVS